MHSHSHKNMLTFDKRQYDFDTCYRVSWSKIDLFSVNLKGEWIFEKAKELQPMGSNMSISIAMVAVFGQLGLYDQFITIKKPFGAMHLKNQ